MNDQTHTPDLQDEELARLQRSAEAPGLADYPLADRRLPAIAVRLVRSRDELAGRAIRQAWSPADLQRYCHSDLPDNEGVVRHGVEADDGVRRELTAAGRSQLDSARLQHAEPPPEDPRRQHPLSWLQRAVAPADPLTGITA